MEEVTEKKKSKTTVGIMFWVFIIVGAVVGSQFQSSFASLFSELFIVIGLALGGIWVFRRFKKSRKS